jgi:hypothetical protein
MRRWFRPREEKYREGAGEYNVTSSEERGGPSIMAWPWFWLSRTGAEDAARELRGERHSDRFLQIRDRANNIVVEYDRSAAAGGER